MIKHKFLKNTRYLPGIKEITEIKNNKNKIKKKIDIIIYFDVDKRTRQFSSKKRE
jgi:hypothetical protein